MGEKQLDRMEKPNNNLIEINLLDIFDEIFHKYASQTAVRHLDACLSYQDLDKRSHQLAAKILSHGLPLQSRVVVCMKPGVEVLVAIIGIYRSGMIYVPLDPTHPPAFCQHMLDETQPLLALVTSQTQNFEPIQGITTWSLDQKPDHESPVSRDLAPNLPKIDPDMTATIFFTSGTTGKPKGVPLSHGNLYHFIDSARLAYGFQPKDIFTSIARYTFSISLFDLLGPLSVGAQTWLMDRNRILMPEEFDRVLNQVSVVHAGPSLLNSLFKYLKAIGQPHRTYPQIRHLSTGGDVVPAVVMEQMKVSFPNAEVFVIFGCTEIACMGTTFPIPRTEKILTSLVGKPFPNVGLLLLDSAQKPVPVGETGEICFSGPGVTRGYLNQPILNKQKFLQLDPALYKDSIVTHDGSSLDAHDGTFVPLPSVPTFSFYKTGDLGRIHPDGNLEILGRQDFQIQLRGIRIELVGIENAVKEAGLAENCVFILQKTIDDERLIAFVVEPKSPDIQSFRAHLGTLVPDFMLPQHLVVLEKMPLTANGKLDRNALQKMPWNQSGVDSRDLQKSNESSPAISSETLDPVLLKIKSVFETILNRSPIGLNENFFDLGGHSLLAVKALYEIQKACHFSLNPQSFFEGPTIRQLHQVITGQQDPFERPVLLSNTTGHPELFMLSGVHLYKPLALQLEGTMTCFGIFTSLEMIAPDAAHQVASVYDLAARYIAIMRRHKPHGPYHLLGYSFAGIIAYEMAQQIRQQGEKVASLTLLDAMLPEWILGTKFRMRQLRRAFNNPLKDVMMFILRKLSKHSPLQTLQKALIGPRYKEDHQMLKMEVQRDIVNHAAAVEYLLQMKPYPDPILLVVSEERLHGDPLKSRSCGWQTYAAQLTIKGVSADHYTMMEEESQLVKIRDYLKGFNAPLKNSGV